MFDVKVSASTPTELLQALTALAAALQGGSEVVAEVAATPQNAAPAPTTPPPAAQPAPAPASPPPAAVPVAAAPTFTQEQIMTAGAALIDAGKMNELMGLLNTFGVQAVTQLKQEQLGAFATELRKLGAQI